MINIFLSSVLLFANSFQHSDGLQLENSSEQIIRVSSLNGIQNKNGEIGCDYGILKCNIICDKQELCNNIIINGIKNNNNNNYYEEISFSCLIEECNNNKFNIFGNSKLYLTNNKIKNSLINIYGNNNQLYIEGSNFVSNIINFDNGNNNINNGIYFDNKSFSTNNTFYTKKV